MVNWNSYESIYAYKKKKYPFASSKQLHAWTMKDLSRTKKWNAKRNNKKNFKKDGCDTKYSQGDWKHRFMQTALRELLREKGHIALSESPAFVGSEEEKNFDVYDRTTSTAYEIQSGKSSERYAKKKHSFGAKKFIFLKKSDFPNSIRSIKKKLKEMLNL